VKDKDQMATAVAAETAPDDKGKGGSVGRPEGGMQVYKPGEGYATRLGIMVVVMSFVGFACHRWFYNWVFVRDIVDGVFSTIRLGVLTGWMFQPAAAKVISIGGTIALAATGFFVAYYFVYVKRNSADFLVKTDIELGKVSWPEVTPWFKAETKVWGATYVVLIFVAILAVYVFVVDYVLNFISHGIFYGN
jgi:preprotein translocase subunit SecE